MSETPDPTVMFEHPCRNCGNPGTRGHVYGERKCCPDCDHRPTPDPTEARIAAFDWDVFHKHQHLGTRLWPDGSKPVAPNWNPGCSCGASHYYFEHPRHLAEVVVSSPVLAALVDAERQAVVDRIEAVCCGAVESHKTHLHVTRNSAPDHRPCESAARAKFAELILALVATEPFRWTEAHNHDPDSEECLPNCPSRAALATEDPS